MSSQLIVDGLASVLDAEFPAEILLDLATGLEPEEQKIFVDNSFPYAVACWDKRLVCVRLSAKSSGKGRRRRRWR